MANRTEHGFTIIELMLFLGISGALFAALMIGVGSNITQQRYRESVVTYSALLQNQYSEAANIDNGRDGSWTCVNSTINQSANGGQARGTTDCVLLGRAIQIEDNGTTVKTSSVVGTEAAGYEDASDIAALLAYKPRIESFDSETTPVDWGSSLVTTDNHPSTATILILRSPSSGLIRVFAYAAGGDTVSDIITPQNATRSLKNCVKGDSLLQPTQSVSVDPRISGPDGIIVDGMDPACK